MSILCSVVSNRESILVYHAGCSKNFSEVIERVVKQSSPEIPKFTYSHARYLCHYIYENGIIFLCITDDNFHSDYAFNFLEDIKCRYQFMYGTTANTASCSILNIVFSKMLDKQMLFYTESWQDGSQIDILKGAMGNEMQSAQNQDVHVLVGKSDILSGNILIEEKINTIKQEREIRFRNLFAQFSRSFSRDESSIDSIGMPAIFLWLKNASIQKRFNSDLIARLYLEISTEEGQSQLKVDAFNKLIKDACTELHLNHARIRTFLSDAISPEKKDSKELQKVRDNLKEKYLDWKAQEQLSLSKFMQWVKKSKLDIEDDEMYWAYQFSYPDCASNSKRYIPAEDFGRFLKFVAFQAKVDEWVIRMKLSVTAKSLNLVEEVLQEEEDISAFGGKFRIRASTSTSTCDLSETSCSTCSSIESVTSIRSTRKRQNSF